MIEFQNIGLCFDSRWVLHNFTAALGKGITWLSGPSGSGKSSLISILLGRLKPSEGKVFYPAGTTFSYCGSRPSMFYEKPFSYNLKHILGFSEPPDRLSVLIEGMKAAPLLKRIPNRLSGGERRKLEIILCLSKRADVYILDEPLSGLDRESKQAVANYLEAHRQEAVFLVVNHDQAVKIKADEIIRLSDDGFSIEGKTAEFSAQGFVSNNNLGLWSCFGHLFLTNKLLCLLEWVLFLAFSLVSLASIALTPPSDGSANRKIVAADPAETFLFSGNPDRLSFAAFMEKVENGSRLVLPLVEETSAGYRSTNGFLLAYEGADFLVLQNCHDSQGYNLRGDYSYTFDGEEVEGRFVLVDQFNQYMESLRDHRLFAEILDGDPGSILLCPQNEFAATVIAMANGVFSATNYYENNGGVAILPSPRLAPLSYMPGLGSLLFDPKWSGIPVVVGDSFRLCLDVNEAPNIFGSRTTLPFEYGEPSVSLAAYLYLCFFGEGMNQSGTNPPLLYLRLDRETALSADLTGLNPQFTIAYFSASLATVRLSLRYCSVGLGVIFLVVFAVSFLRSGRFESRAKEVLILNGMSKSRADAYVGSAYLLIPVVLIILSLLVYVCVLLPGFNLLQEILDYPHGYGDAIASFPSIPPIGFYSFSPWSLLFFLCPFIYLLHLLPERKKGR